MRARVAIATVVLVVSAGLAAAADELPAFTVPAPKGNITAYPIPGLDNLIVVRTQAGQPNPILPKAGAPAPKAAPRAVVDPVETDKRLARIVYDAASVGTLLWDQQNYEGTFRLYQGTVAAVIPFLDHRPKLSAVAQAALVKSAQMKPTDGAFILREALDAVQKETAVALTPKPLWDRLGGEKVVRAVVKDFVGLVSKDQQINTKLARGKNKFEAKDYERLEEALVAAISQQTGGPLKPAEGATLKDALAGTKLGYLEGIGLKTNLSIAIGKNKVPDAERKELEDVLGKLQNQILGQ